MVVARASFLHRSERSVHQILSFNRPWSPGEEFGRWETVSDFQIWDIMILAAPWSLELRMQRDWNMLTLVAPWLLELGTRRAKLIHSDLWSLHGRSCSSTSDKR
ncbi:hypothetical protein L195_g009453 [Trifolium pratense]|uniref:Uncharacterized protein n=1 Tax=Trifolium pratense TaxID=57577 RepID=A0A2K3PC34_TRIPR|nr:hypothetical protein L195_g009453 [Trifolium pratense]